MMRGNILRKVVMILGIQAVVAGLFGCAKIPDPVKHELSDISAVSIACAHMDRSYGYSFWIHHEEEKWLFDAECFTHEHEVETVFENREVANEEVDALFAILEESDIITYAQNYKKPPKLPFRALDETTYTFCLNFSDGSQSVTSDPQARLEEFFYHLAESLAIQEPSQ